MNQNHCTKCGCGNLFMKPSGSNIGLYCSNCGAWIKWMNKNEIRVFEHENKVVNSSKGETDCDIQCAACGYIGDESNFFHSAAHEKFRICPKCGTVRFICEENRGFRK